MAVDAATCAGKLSPPGDESEDTSAADVSSATDESDDADVIDYVDVDPDAAEMARPASRLRLAFVAGFIMIVALGSLSGWLGVRAYHSQHTAKERELYLQVARQGALNLTTIDYQHADADIQRILDAATGQFHDDFSQRSRPFVEVVKQTQTTSVGTVTAAGVESMAGDQAQVIVAVSVKTSIGGTPEQQPRAWRMRLTVHKAGQDVKVSNVGFVP